MSENVDRKSDYFDSIRRVILPKIVKGYFSTAFFDSIKNSLRPFLMLAFFPIGNCLFPIEHFSTLEIFVPYVLCWPFFCCWSFRNVEGVCSKDC